MKKSNNLKNFVVAFAFCCAPSLIFGLEVAGSDTAMTKNGEEIGTLYKGAQIQKDGASYKIKAAAMSGNEYMLFYNDKDRIKLARISNDAIKNLKVLSEEEDEYGVKWKNVELNFEVKDPSAIKNTKDGLWAAEEELYHRCGSCHVAKTLEEYTINQWPNVVKTMSDRAGFSKDETRLVGSYLQYKLLEKSAK